ncbi:MAG: GNAT family N-acetyltransferase [Thermomicrobiales bacterium]|nr:GNAT family N-acetyltransferase [Thermomicrobiales bacterium]
MSARDATIRDFEPRDQEVVRSLVLAGLGEHWGYIDETLNPDLDDIAAAYPADRARVLVAEDRQGQIVGCGCVVQEEGAIGRLVRMSVARAARGRGLGRRLVTELEAIAVAWGCTRLVCETTHDWTDAIALYRSAGFTEVDVRDGDRHFEKQLPAAVEEFGVGI